MTRLTFALCFLLGSATAAVAQDSTKNSDQYRTEEQELQIVNEKIEARDLPESIKSVLVGQEYRGWLVNAVFKSPKVNPDTTANSNDVMYVVELISGTQTQTVEFDKNGNRMNDPEEDRE